MTAVCVGRGSLSPAPSVPVLCFWLVCPQPPQLFPGPHYQILPSLLVSPALSFLGCDFSSLPFIVVIVDSWFLMRLSCGLPSFSTSEVDLAWCFLGAGLLKKIKNDLFPSPMHMM